MDESNFRNRLRNAIGEPSLPAHVPAQTRLALRQAAANEPSRHRWIPGFVAGVLAIGIVAGFLAIDTLTRSPAPVAIAPQVQCAASSLLVTGIQGERMHPNQLPPGFVLEQGSESELGGVGFLTYTTSGYGDRPWLELGRYNTSEPAETLLGASQKTAVIVQGNPGVLATGAPGGSDDVAVAWRVSPGIVLFVSGYKIPATEVVAVANRVTYSAGTVFTYPAQPKVSVSRQRALSALPGATSSSRAVLTSFGEVDAVSTPSGLINHVPTLSSDIGVTLPVWVVWQGGQTGQTLTARQGVVIDANSGVELVDLKGVKPASLLALTDRSQNGCEPPFGVLTRSEIKVLVPTVLGTSATLKLITLRMLISIRDGSALGDCSLAACDPDVPVWVWIGTADDCRLMFRCGPPPNPSASALPTPPPGSWALRPFDARTGPQNTELSGGSAGHGPVPADVASLPDLASAP